MSAQQIENIVVSIWKSDGFASRIAKAIGQSSEMTELMQSRSFRNEEYNPEFQPIDPNDLSKGFLAKDKHVFIIAAPNSWYTPQELVQRCVLAAKSAKDNGAYKVTVVMPDLVYGRADRSPSQDPEHMGGKAFSLESLAQSFAWHVDHVLTLHPHSKDVQKIFGRTYSQFRLEDVDGSSIVYSLSSAPIIAHYLVSQDHIAVGKDGGNAVLLVPDEGAVEVNDAVYNLLGLNHLQRAYADKARTKPNDPNCVKVTLKVPQEIFNRKVVIYIDDAIDTAGTLKESFKHVGNAKKRIVYSTHPWLAGNLPSDDAQDILHQSNIDLFIFGNTHPDRIHTMSDDLLNRRVVFIDYVKFIADAIVNCVARTVQPSEHYQFKDLNDLLRRAGALYDTIDRRVPTILL